MKFTILHIADLHCNPTDELYLKPVSRALCEDLRVQIKNGKEPALVCVTGDIVDKGQDCFDLADSVFFKPLQDVLKIPKSRFFFVPGNHDIDRKQISAPFEFGLQQSLNSQGAFRQFYHETQRGGPNLDFLTRKFHLYNAFVKQFTHETPRHSSLFYNVYEVQADLKIGIVELNSSWRCSNGDDARRLIIGQHIVVEAASMITNCDLRICLCHHPLEMLADWDMKPVRQAIAKHFHILLNGHVHDADAMETKLILGNLFVSTTGCLNQEDPFSTYTLITLDFDKDSIICDFRKWYKEREVFDQDTSKAAAGHIEFPGIKSGASNSASALTVAVIRGKLQAEREQKNIVCPIEGINDVELEDVFIEPLLTNKSGFDRDTEGRETLSLLDLLRSKANLFLAGRAEFGKTTLLKYARDYILKNDKHFDAKIPVLLDFHDISVPNLKSLIRHIAKILGQTEEQTIAFAQDGLIIFLIDDFNDRQDINRGKKTKVVRELFHEHPKCRYLFSSTEHLAPNQQLELITDAADFKSQIAYIGSLNTARIRQLLLKWKQKQDFDIESMLNQILYYFQHCQIPVTPLAVTLFLGVLFNQRKERKIRNEAFLIENYLETILEKFNPRGVDEEQDFRDKEDYLAALAWYMVKQGRHSIELNELERFKIDYFDNKDEDLPRPIFFETFFDKGILIQDEGVVFFSRRIWLNFFLAKALDWDKETLNEFLERKDVLKFSKALAYKAGLTRKELDLLKWVDERAMKGAHPIIEKYLHLELSATEHRAPISYLSETIAKELREKNTDDSVDARRDSTFLNYDEDKSSMDDEQIDQFDDLITLQSDILRNTTWIKAPDKGRFIENNVACYVAMMWCALEMFRETLQQSDEEELYKLFFKEQKSASMRQKMKVVIEHAQRIVHFVVPLSVLVYMDEHLGTPKLAKSFRRLAETATSPTKRLFYYILLFAQLPREGIRQLKSLVTADSCNTVDFVICGFLKWYCYQNKVDQPVLDKIVAIFEAVRKKHAKRVEKPLPFLRDTFQTDLRKDLQSKHYK